MQSETQFDLDRVLEKAIHLGASYADARYQHYDYELVVVENKELKSYSSRTLSGVGIRVSVNNAVGYASTSDLSEKSLQKTVENAIKAAKSVKGQKHKLREVKANKVNVKSPVKIDPVNVSPEEKVSLVLDANKAAWTGESIRNASTYMGLSKDYRLFQSSEGADVRVETILTGLAHDSVAMVGGVMEHVTYSDNLCAGFEFLKSKDWNAFTIDISGLAVEAASSKTAPAGTHVVVMDPETVGLLLHEAFGHASEGDILSTGESVLFGKLGTQTASEFVTIIDEGTVNGGFYYPYDDEGTPKEKTVIVENGVLKNYIHSRNTAAQFEAEPTGNGRAQDFENIPIVRQTNYYMQPGNHSFEELIEDVDFGIYIRGKGTVGGQVSPGMGAFTFNVGPSKIIRKGELAETVRSVVISGLILETLKTIDAVGKDLEIRTNVFGGCGKYGQMVRVGAGGPHIRVGKMTVGGK